MFCWNCNSFLISLPPISTYSLVDGLFYYWCMHVASLTWLIDCFQQFPCWWQRHNEICCSVFPRDVWICHSTHPMALSASWKSAEAKLSAHGGQLILKLLWSVPYAVWMYLVTGFIVGLQDCGRPEVLQEIKWEADYKSPECDLSASSGSRASYHAGGHQCCKSWVIADLSYSACLLFLFWLVILKIFLGNLILFYFSSPLVQIQDYALTKFAFSLKLLLIFFIFNVLHFLWPPAIERGFKYNFNMS